MPHSNSPGRKQRGAVLAVAIALLAIMTVVALATNELTKLEGRQASSLLNQDASFELAEKALRAGEQSLVVPGTECQATPEAFAHTQTGTQPEFPQATREWWARKASKLSTDSTQTHTASDISNEAYYLTQVHALTASVAYFAVTARAEVGREISMVQTIYAIPTSEAARGPNTCGRQSWRQLK